MKAKVSSILFKQIFNEIPIGGLEIFHQPTGYIEVDFSIKMKARDFIFSRDLCRMGKDVDVYLIVKKRKGKKNEKAV
jgi:hypothetical protein